MKQFHLLLILLSLILLISPTNTQSTKLIYYSQYQIQKQQDFIEISITVNCQNNALKNAVEKAKNIVGQLENIFSKFCIKQRQEKQKEKKSSTKLQKTMKNKKQSKQEDQSQVLSACLQLFTSSKHTIKPKYQLVRKVQTFMAFIVSHKITIKITNQTGVGKMVDQLLKTGQGLITIDKFQWKSQNQNNPQKQALKSGMKDGQQICQKMGMKLKSIISVQEVDQKEDQDNNKDQEDKKDQKEQNKEDDQEQDEQNNQTIVFRFQVECANQ